MASRGEVNDDLREIGGVGFGSLSRMRLWTMEIKAKWTAVAMLGLSLGLGLGKIWAQAPVPASADKPAGATTVPDLEMEAAGTLVGKALFLRGFYLNNDLNYDAGGRVQGTPKVGDWTLAAMNVLKVERREAGEIELDGVRVAIRYNPDNHEFQRHALNDEKIRLVVKDAESVLQLEAAFAAMFSVGIDPGLQRAMPDYWRHYFDPALAWPQDGLSGQTIYPLYGQADQNKDVTTPAVTHRADAKYSDFATRDKVQGALQLRIVVDASGVPRHIAVSRPLGYGLDANAVEAMSRWRFSAGMRGGSPVATGVVIEQQFSLVAPPR